MSSAEFVSIAVGASTILGGIAFAIGQFLSARRKGLQESLSTAVAEIAVLNGKLSRLEGEMRAMHEEMSKLRQENRTLRSVITKALEENSHG